MSSPIGIFDSGYGGLTILKEIKKRLPEYNYLYLGDNARAPYGPRSFEVVYSFTLEAVKYLFDAGCRLVILACNTASAKALRTIQQVNLPEIDPSRRVLGVIRPTVEILDKISHNGHVGLLATVGTVNSHSFKLETAKLYPEMTITELAAPMWVPLIENNEAESDGADYFVKKYIDELFRQDAEIDTIVLGCTHYPLLLKKIRRYVPENVTVLSQGGLIAESLADYLRRHPEIECLCRHDGTLQFLTTENPEKFNDMASIFMGDRVSARQVVL